MSDEHQEIVYQFALVSFLFPVLLGTILIWFIISYQKKKFQNETDKKDALLREQALLIEKQQAIESERTRIASEMHDDLGSGLTTIRYLSDKALAQVSNATEANEIRKIADHSNALVRNMSEIIWAMNSRFDNAENLVGYLRRYASEFLEERGIPFKFSVTEDQMGDISIGGEKRRNLFLVFKEVLHNAVKYSGAAQINIDVDTHPQLSIRISEINGIGFDPLLSSEKGNGLYNCQKRMTTIQGNISFEKTNDAMQTIITAPIHSTTHG